MDGCKEVSVLFLICFHSLAAEKPESAVQRGSEAAAALRVTVNVYNGVNLPLDELSRAESEAERIFRYAGIKLVWTSGLLGREATGDKLHQTWDSPVLQLRIWPRAPAGKRPSGSDTLGFCLSFENGDAVVLADSVQNHVVSGSPDFANLLGIAMAHELGHLLLRSAAHSASGIMRARLSDKTRRDDERGYLRFTSQEAESIRNEIARARKEESRISRP